MADKFATTGELPPSPLTVNVPVIVPAAVGVTARVKPADCPTPSAIGKVAPDQLNCELDSVACVMFSATEPVLETVTVCVVFLPTVTEPKLMLFELSPNMAETACEPALTRPAHPFSIRTEASNSTVTRLPESPEFIIRFVVSTGQILSMSAPLVHYAERKSCWERCELAEGTKEGQLCNLFFRLGSRLPIASHFSGNGTEEGPRLQSG